MKSTIQRVFGKGKYHSHKISTRDRRARLQSRPSLDGLEKRDLMAVGGTFDARTGLLSIYGTAASDVVRVDYATKVVDGTATTDTANVFVSLIGSDGSEIDQTFTTSGLKNIIFYGKAGNDLFNDNTSYPFSIAATTGTVSTNLLNGAPNNNTPGQAPVGVFTVGSTGTVTFDYIYDGAGYQGQLGFYSLTGMSSFTPGTAAYNKEVATRVLSNSTQGHIAISVATEAAKFSATLPWESNFNTGHGTYKGPHAFTMTPGDTFGIVLIPNGTFSQVKSNPSAGGSLTPLYSIPAANPYQVTSALLGAQAADLDGHGSLFSFEDLRLDSGSDRDYNDCCFQITGARGNEPFVQTVQNSAKQFNKQSTFTNNIQPYTNSREAEDSSATIGTYASGVGTVGESGLVGLDFLYDGGGYQSEVAIFSLQGMGSLTPGSPGFIKEAARRALTNTTLGHVVISDMAEGAKYSTPVSWEPNFNTGSYKGIKNFAMTAGDKFGTMLVPAGTVWEAFNNSTTTDPKKRPLFSMPEANPTSSTYGRSQFAQFDSNGTVFGFEDLGLTTNKSDRDYNDIVFRFIGAYDSAPTLATVVEKSKNTLTTSAGTKILS